jgi:hypothetical protein
MRQFSSLVFLGCGGPGQVTYDFAGPLEPRRHLYHFTAETLTRLLTDVGLKVTR